ADGNAGTRARIEGRPVCPTAHVIAWLADIDRQNIEELDYQRPLHRRHRAHRDLILSRSSKPLCSLYLLWRCEIPVCSEPRWRALFLEFWVTPVPRGRRALT